MDHQYTITIIHIFILTRLFHLDDIHSIGCISDHFHPPGLILILLPRILKKLRKARALRLLLEQSPEFSTLRYSQLRQEEKEYSPMQNRNRRGRRTQNRSAGFNPPTKLRQHLHCSLIVGDNKPTLPP